MTKARDIITDSLIQLNALDPNEALEANAASAALRELNRMLSSWANEELMIFDKARLTFNLVGNQQSYTLGVGGNFNTTYPVRPNQLDLISVQQGTTELSLEILNDEQWRDVPVKATSSTIPLQVWMDGGYPLNTLWFWPIPTVANPVIMTVWSQITAFADVNADVTLPQGYEDALVTNLAVRLSSGYATQPSPILAQIAQSSKARIKSMNWEPTYRTVDSALAGSGSNMIRKSRGYVID